MEAPVLEIKGLGKSFGPVRALNNINLVVQKGEIHAICGENGAGKSTLMKILDGFYPYGTYDGEFYISGEKCCFQSPADSTKAGVSMIYQEISVLKFMTLADNIFAGNFPVKKGFIDKKELHRKAREVLDKVGLNASTNTIAGTLNTSQQQLLMIAQSLTHNPKILILDEPTSALTQKETQKLMSIINNLRDNGVACLYISHKLDELAKIADKLTIFRDGEYVETLNKGEFDIDRIITGMVGRSIKNIYPVRNNPIGEPVLEIKNLTVPNPSVAKKYLVKDLSFELRKGEVLGFAGLVGAGRSEALNALYGFIKKSNGTVKLFGSECNIKSPADSLQAGIALLTEDRKDTGLFEGCTVSENMTSANLGSISKFSLISSKKEKKAVNEYIEKLRIKTPSGETLINNLSGGNQQKVVLAKSLMTQPQIMMLDEPTRGIDVGSKHEIYLLINKLVEEGYSIIMISSELPELLNMCDRIIVMAEGVKKTELNRSEATDQNVMKAATSVNTSDLGRG